MVWWLHLRRRWRHVQAYLGQVQMFLRWWSLIRHLQALDVRQEPSLALRHGRLTTNLEKSFHHQVLDLSLVWRISEYLMVGYWLTKEVWFTNFETFLSISFCIKKKTRFSFAKGTDLMLWHQIDDTFFSEKVCEKHGMQRNKFSDHPNDAYIDALWIVLTITNNNLAKNCKSWAKRDGFYLALHGMKLGRG